ncbi:MULTISPECIES: heme ABC transporter permease CcmC [Legionella]|uniref:Heme exporter protein C n=1 Tax=Legionella quinlivanii TaxID=45073 RepID=A0A364LMS4_9GAMM|nr:heme ABC transporter permease [Legionella quinlivanii]
MIHKFPMWKFLYQMASPQSFFNKTQRWLGVLGWLACIFLILGFAWGLIFAPADYQQGDAFRIIYIHVPAAFLSLSLYGFMAFMSLLLLVWRIKLAGLMLNAAAQTGACMAFIALATGSIWGKPMWGTWWVWDARLTSELILLVLYIAILATAATFKNKDQGDRLVAVLTLVGAIDLPVIHYSVYWWNTLHQGATLSLFAKPKIALPMLYPLLLTLAGFSFFCVWVILHKAGNELLIREKRQHWVRKLLEENV